MRGQRGRARRAAAVVAALVLVASVGGCAWGDDLPGSTRLCDLGRDNDQGVAGHDLAASTRLPDDRVLFAFGDTYLGTVDGDARDVTGLLGSSGAVLPADEDICGDGLRYLTDDDGDVRSLLPDPPAADTAYWPVDLAVRDGQVWMLYRWVERTGDGSLELAVRGTGLAVADAEDLEFTSAARLLVEGGTPLPSALTAVGPDLVALVCQGGGGEACRLQDLDTDSLALVPGRPEPPVELAAAEMGLGRVERAGEEVWRVSSMPALCADLEVAVLGDDGWDVDPVLSPEPSSGGLCYAGRVQEAFSGPDVLIATWVESPEERADADVYWPHVERITLDD